MYEVELEYMCEADPSVWEDQSNHKWEESTCLPGEIRDSTTGEVLNPAKVAEGCEGGMGLMSQMRVWDRMTREGTRQGAEAICSPYGSHAC